MRGVYELHEMSERDRGRLLLLRMTPFGNILSPHSLVSSPSLSFWGCCVLGGVNSASRRVFYSSGRHGCWIKFEHSATPHLLVIQPFRASGEAYYFNLDTAAFDELRRQTAFCWAPRERLTRSIAQQAVGQGDDKITLKGAVFPGFKGGLGQLQALRSIGRGLQPLGLTTGYPTGV